MSFPSTIRYFCYGSNLLSDRIRVKLKGSIKISIGILSDYKLTFSGHSNLWKGATADVIPSEGSQVIGIIWSITYKDLEQLNLQEKGYKLIAITVESEEDNQLIECITYVQTEEEKVRGRTILGSMDGIPTIVYKEVIVRGAIEHNLPEDYIEMIKSFDAKEEKDCELAHLVGLK
ncbi:gamma-glutamylcyclotransferase-like [Panonychus citri]|uniref:gamma-glutamylcyclotransferase-like n=1 Tax=Panonychus citri TaxID=50023 RepID=UPI002307A522|nr:gamma-glutamylcyclotransferase-like [Panonychus citri]XP_053214994.1 gamma-glutamylcyclotransferase-like [Panonychus citri]